MIIGQPVKEDNFRLHCDECDGARGVVSDFDVVPIDLVHIDEVARTIVLFASCPQGHRIPVESEFAYLNSEVRATVDALRRQLGKVPSNAA